MSRFGFVFSIAVAGSAAVATTLACSGGEDFTAESTGGTGGGGGTPGDGSTTDGASGGGSGGSGGSSGSGATAGAAGQAGGGGLAGGGGSGGEAGTGTGGEAGAATGGAAGTDGGGTGGGSSGKADGQPCANKLECKSGYCVDDVCCESECAGTCQSCELSGKEGLCSPYAASSDPEGECVGAGAPTAPCAGVCDGKSACDYPDGSKSCGAQVCASASVSTFACDNAGACKETKQSCGAYQCSGASCSTTCGQDSQCVSGNWCDLPNCVLQKSLGAFCPKDSACQSGHCVAGQCCSTACGPGFTCESGSCQCGGQTCTAGATCNVWYQDADGDGFGDAVFTKLACTKPSGWVANTLDCDDGDANAFPGQTKFFSTPRKGKGGYDYNCDNASEKQIGVINPATCKVCGNFSLCPTPTAPPCTAGSFGCQSLTSCPGAGSGFATEVACGTLSTLKVCQQGSALQGTPPNQYPVCTTSATVFDTPNTPQPCR